MEADSKKQKKIKDYINLNDDSDENKTENNKVDIKNDDSSDDNSVQNNVFDNIFDNLGGDEVITINKNNDKKESQQIDFSNFEF